MKGHAEALSASPHEAGQQANAIGLLVVGRLADGHSLHGRPSSRSR